jgi:hypothetical protein
MYPAFVEQAATQEEVYRIEPFLRHWHLRRLLASARCPPFWKTKYESFATKPQLLRMKLLWIRSFLNYGLLLRNTSTILISGRLR